MSVESLLSRLNGVRPAGKGRWVARCPAHDDHHPSLAIRLLDDGRILLRDFGGCDTESVLLSVGMSFADLFPERALGQQLPRARRPFNSGDVLSCLALEILVVIQLVDQLGRGIPFTSLDRQRLMSAAQRFQSAEKIIHE